jgi:hypothetical protein
MTEQRKQEIIAVLQGIYNTFTPTDDEPELTMFGLISRYNATGQNIELIGGDWVIENCPEPLKSLPI